MANRMLFGVTFAAVGALTYGWYHNHQQIAQAQQSKIEEFINVGPRFTGTQGWELCEVVRIVALHSIGFQQSGLPLPDCEKYLKLDKLPPAPTQLKVVP